MKSPRSLRGGRVNQWALALIDLAFSALDISARKNLDR